MRRYNVWAGNPKGTLEDRARCIAQVAEGGRSPLFYQCGRKRGHGPDGLYCRQHGRMVEEGRHVHVPKDRDGEGVVR